MTKTGTGKKEQRGQRQQREAALPVTHPGWVPSSHLSVTRRDLLSRAETVLGWSPAT